MLEAVAVSLRVQAAGKNHAALKPLADVIRRLTIAASSPEALSTLFLTQANLYFGLGRFKKAVDTAEKSFALVAKSAMNLLPSLVGVKAEAMAYQGESDQTRLRALRKQMKLCENAPAALRSVTITSVAKAHFAGGDLKKADKLIKMAVEMNESQIDAILDTPFNSDDELAFDWICFISKLKLADHGAHYSKKKHSIS